MGTHLCWRHSIEEYVRGTKDTWTVLIPSRELCSMLRFNDPQFISSRLLVPRAIFSPKMDTATEKVSTLTALIILRLGKSRRRKLSSSIVAYRLILLSCVKRNSAFSFFLLYSGKRSLETSLDTLNTKDTAISTTTSSFVCPVERKHNTRF